MWYINRDRSFYRFVTMHACDRQTDRQTDGRTEFSSLDRVCIPCSAVKIDNKRTFQRTLTHFIFAMNVRNNYACCCLSLFITFEWVFFYSFIAFRSLRSPSQRKSRLRWNRSVSRWPCTRDRKWPSTPSTRLKSVLLVEISSNLSTFVTIYLSSNIQLRRVGATTVLNRRSTIGRRAFPIAGARTCFWRYVCSVAGRLRAAVEDRTFSPLLQYAWLLTFLPFIVVLEMDFLFRPL